MNEKSITPLTFDDLPTYKAPIKKNTVPQHNKREFKIRKNKTKSINKKQTCSLEEFNSILCGLGKKRISPGPYVAKRMTIDG